jgi:UDP-glucose 4-epimerase
MVVHSHMIKADLPWVRRAFVTGAAGFIGSHMVDRLLAAGKEVVGYDDLSTGMIEFLAAARDNPAFSLVRGDVLDERELKAAMAGSEIVFHFAANADVRHGLEHPRKDLEQNTIATFNVVEAMRANGVKQIVFASSGSIYGEAATVPTPEDAPFPVQTSLYGASKLASEGLIMAYCEGFGMRAWIFRFVSILGERYTHGHVFDFYRQLRVHPMRLRVLGDGRQRKSYLYVQDCIDAIFHAMVHAQAKVNVFNLGTNEYCEVNDSIAWITSQLGLAPTLEYTGGTRGWVGDNPFIFLDTARVAALGWHPTLTIREGVERTIAWLTKNQWVLERRN